MMIETILSTLILVIGALCFMRLIVNWVLLNEVEGTSHPKIFNAKPMDLFLTVRHFTISAFKIWWTGGEFKKLKYFSNTLSTSLYISIASLILIIIIEYKI